MAKRSINVVSLTERRMTVANLLLDNANADKQWLLDQVLQKFLGGHYEQFIEQYNAQAASPWDAGQGPG